MGVLSDILMFSPLLVIGYSIFYFIDNRHRLRKGAGIRPNDNLGTEEAETNLIPDSDDGISSEHSDFEEENENGDDEILDQYASDPENNLNGRPLPIPRKKKNRLIGAKKSKSIEKRDKKRQYNEFVRQQAMARKLAEKEWQDKYGDLIAAQSEARDYREQIASLEIKRRKENMRETEKKKKEQLERTRIALMGKLITKNKVKLTADEQLVVKDLEDSLMKKKIFLVNNGQWIIKLHREDIMKLKEKIREMGSMTIKDFGEYLKVSI
ncbi:hypothetical protein NADFUDRAFT_52921 [Nadsonia fulvescens var. elongata DSM 6958]|uniref:Uncharacterized protein n=1 Tax=Nadsonia fulvescens var. elongata DSM 6958 TaxID=857566 RepID=A0A1E3PEV9_9ASCO|nr:hypothetical protein NADFUDRAFT_52921 [Nadsonia fulvescens var. elongata DSM 6958]